MFRDVPGAYLLVAFFLGAFVFFLCFCLLSRIRNRRDRRAVLPSEVPVRVPVEPLSPEFAPSDYATILSDIDLGVLAFDARRKLVYLNQTARAMLGDRCADCEDLDAFLTEYGAENGLKAGVVLGKRALSGVLVRNGRSVLLDVHELRRDGRRHFTTVTTFDITQREQLEKQRKQFLANVSHELKTPLTTIVSYSESLVDWGLQELKPDEIYGNLKRIYEEAGRMQSLVNDLALLSSLDSRGIRPRMEELDLQYLVRFCVERFQFQAGTKDIRLGCSVHPDVPLVFGERRSLERILNNLIENAIKYTQAGGTVDVYLNAIHGEVYWKIKDSGQGIPPDDLPLVFNRFFRVDNSGSSVLGGTGLGLAIAKELVELHGGRISVTSAPGVGSEFIVFLPTAARVMRESLEAARKQLPLHGVLQEMAAEALLRQAQEAYPSVSLLSDLTEDRAEALVAHYEKDASAPAAAAGEDEGRNEHEDESLRISD